MITGKGAPPRHAVYPADRAEVIDRVNRLNVAFDEWDIEAMVAAFTEDCVIDHPRGAIRGHDQLRAFYADYFPLTPGVRRHSLNHVVDPCPGGELEVLHYTLLVRVAAPSDAEAALAAPLTDDTSGLPAIFIHAIVTDRFRHDRARGWRIARRRVESTVANAALRPASPV
uniref:SnoaL-like domain-containing protein n=1 Tax=Caulobacter sp. (strain K31) TaxID=366602 RepID=B0T983_CAUSK